MVVIRFFLGFSEAVFLPGALLLLSKWVCRASAEGSGLIATWGMDIDRSKQYTRKELALRNAILFCGNLISNAFSALVGAGVLSSRWIPPPRRNRASLLTHVQIVDMEGYGSFGSRSPPCSCPAT